LNNTLKTYYTLTKPGIIYGNLMTAAGGFLFASKGHVNIQMLIAGLLGIALVIACGCVTNNYIDRDIDSKMKRTKKRALVIGSVPPANAIAFAAILGISGLLLLRTYTNMLTVYLGIFALFSYVVLYGFAKRTSVHGTLVGSIAGSMSLVAGYAAASNRLDTGALLLFLILASWQMPHFYAIATYRMKEYQSAQLPVLTVVKGIPAAKRHIVFYIGVFIIACTLLTIFGYAGYSYLAVMLIMGTRWFWLAVKGFGISDNVTWARRLFGFSLLVLLSFSFMISVDSFLP
jgi:heme o synthase